jgi:predicted MFS family arabinose efflux permease
MLLYGSGNAVMLIAALIVFFSAFNILEANLPSLVSKAAPARAKGTALGVYSSLQFLGIFAGGALGGFVHQSGGATAVFAFTMTLALIWLIVAAAVRRRAA